MPADRQDQGRRAARHHGRRLQRPAAGGRAQGEGAGRRRRQGPLRHHLRLRRLRRGAGARQGQERRGQAGASSPGPTPSGSPRARASPPPSRSRSSASTARSTPTTSRRPATPPPGPTSRCTPWPWARPSSPPASKTIAEYRAAGFEVAFVGDVVGTGSSRKSACNSVQWAIGEDIPFVPNKRQRRRHHRRRHRPHLLQHRAGLRRAAHQGRRLEAQDRATWSSSTPSRARSAARAARCSRTFTLDARDHRRRVPRRRPHPAHHRPRPHRPRPQGAQEGAHRPLRREDQPGAAEGAGLHAGAEDGRPGLRPAGRAARLVRRAEDDHRRLAGHHRPHDRRRAQGAGLPEVPGAHGDAVVLPHRGLPQGGRREDARDPAQPSSRPAAAWRCRPGDGVIHSWLNRLLLPDTVGTGGDSHTRFPIGISFPAGSGLVAFAAALGFMPLEMPKSVLVRFKGKLNPGITLRDVVNAIPLRGHQVRRPDRAQEGEEEHLQRHHPGDGGAARPDRRAGLRADRRRRRALAPPPPAWPSRRRPSPPTCAPTWR